jgi:hypothetical protein
LAVTGIPPFNEIHMSTWLETRLNNSKIRYLMLQSFYFQQGELCISLIIPNVNALLGTGWSGDINLHLKFVTKNVFMI